MMPEAGHLVLLALLCAGATAYYQPRDLQDSLTGVDVQQLMREAADHEVEQGGWEPATDPRYYVLTEQRPYDDSQALPGQRVKRNNGPSLSIVNSLDVLRQRLLLEIARRRMRQSEDQILANRELLKSIGKRDVHSSRTSSVTSSAWPSSRNQPQKS